jgi:phosphoadenosine phosphosulfate reductase
MQENLLFWCGECNVPLLGEACGKCGSSAKRIMLPPYTDPRPAFHGDLEIIREAMKNSYGEDFTESVIADSHQTVLTSLHFLDQAYEIVQDGAPIGRVFFDMYTLSWRFKPLAEGCIRLWEEKNIGVKVDGNGLSEGTVLTRGSYRMAWEPSLGTFLPLVDSDSNIIGLGELTERGILVNRVWKNVERTEGRKASLKDVLDANEHYLTKGGSRACKFLLHLNQRFRRKVVVSYSGGKDSLVLLLLTLKSEIEPLLFFNDTGLEMPETVENVHNVASKLGLKLLIADAGGSFWQYFESFGPPARDYRWCCKVCKLIPTSRMFLSYGEVLSLVGQRRRESPERARSQDVWRNYWIKSALVASPINDWSMLQVWLYLAMNSMMNLVNPLYFKGFDRIGCFMCPACRIAEFNLVEKLHPELWFNWESSLRKWVSERNIPNEWVSYHLWRWLKPPSKISRFTRELGLEINMEESSSRMLLRIVSIQGGADGVVVSLNISDIPIEKLANIAVSLGETSIEDGVLTIKREDFEAYVSRNGSIMIKMLKESSVEKAIAKTVSLVARTILCRGCGSCADNCPIGAIQMASNIPVVDGQLCLRCEYGSCMKKCPVNSFFSHSLLNNVDLEAKCSA